MFSSDLLFVLRGVLTSPVVIGIVAFALLYLKLVLFIINYHKKSSFSKKFKKAGKNNTPREKRSKKTSSSAIVDSKEPGENNHSKS